MLKYNIAIVGGGIVGTTIARELIKKHPALSISVIDKKLAGAGASFYSAGVHFPRGASEKVRNMSLFSHNYYQQLADSGQPVYPLAMELITKKSNKIQVEKSYLPLVDFNQVDTCSHNFVDLSATEDDDLLVLRGYGANYANVFALVNFYLQELRHKVDYLEGTEVNAIQRDEAGYQLSLSSGVRLHAEQVIVVPGPWINHPLCRDPLAAAGIRVKKIVAMHINIEPEEDASLIVFDEDDAFLLPCHSRKQWLFSYTCTKWDVDPDAIRPFNAQDLVEARETLARYAPALASHLKDGRVFCDAYSPSREPAVIQSDDGIIFVSGCNGSGYRLAPAIAADVIHLIPQNLVLEK